MSRVSVFVDGENIPASHALRIFHAAQELGEVDLLRVYGDVGRLRGWEDIPGYRLIHSGTGKNAADLLLTVDAMDRALSGDCDAVVIASSDGDFRHLAERLRERGLMVLGMGEEKAGMRFKASCTRFVALNKPGLHLVEPASSGQPTVGPVSGLAALTERVIRKHGCHGRQLTLSTLGQLMMKHHGVTKKDLTSESWASYLESLGGIFLVERPGGQGAFVRLRIPSEIAAE